MLQNKKYTQIVEKTFRVTQAALDQSTSSEEDVQVILCNDEKSFLICTLKKNKICQVPLDLLISRGDAITFSSKGDGVVHLTGYVDEECNEYDVLFRKVKVLNLLWEKEK